MISDKYLKALYLVSDLFRNINREISDLPYIVHLVAVSKIVESVTDDEDLIIAALLHDVIEDIPTSKYSRLQLENDFGKRIYNLVKNLSHNGNKLTKQRYLDRLFKGGSDLAIVSGADLLHNTLDMIAAYKSNKSEVISIFGGEKAKIRDWFYLARANIINQTLGSNHPLTVQINKKISLLHAIHLEIM